MEVLCKCFKTCPIDRLILSKIWPEHFVCRQLKQYYGLDVPCPANNRAAIAGHSLASECPGRNYRSFAGQRLSGP